MKTKKTKIKKLEDEYTWDGKCARCREEIDFDDGGLHITDDNRKVCISCFDKIEEGLDEEDD